MASSPAAPTGTSEGVGASAPASSLSTMTIPSLVMPAPSAHLQAVQQLRSVLAQLTAVTESTEHVAALEGRVAEYESMLGAASLAQRKFIAQIGALEKQLAEANKKKATTTGSHHHHQAEAHAGAAPTAVTPAAHSAVHPSTVAGHLATQLQYPSQFESNLAMFLGDHLDDQQARDEMQEVWTWMDFPTQGNDLATATGATAYTLPPPTVDKMLKLQLTKPVQLFPCARLGVGLDLGFQQFHQLMYLQTIASMQMQMP